MVPEILAIFRILQLTPADRFVVGEKSRRSFVNVPWRAQGGIVPSAGSKFRLLLDRIFVGQPLAFVELGLVKHMHRTNRVGNGYTGVITGGLEGDRHL